MARTTQRFGFIVYLFLLVATVVVALSLALARDAALSNEFWPWLGFVAFLAAVELTDLNFHQEGGRWGLSASEAILLPLVVGFSFSQVVLGVIIGMGVVRVLRWRSGLAKVLFNIASDGVAAAAAAGLWAWLARGSGFTPRNAFVAVAAVLVFAVLTHVFVAIAIALAEKNAFLPLLRDVAPAAIWNLAGNITIGLLLAAAYTSGTWTVLLAPLPLGALYIGYRAVVRQQRERERMEYLHSASRALAASPDLEHALVEFLRAVRDMVSAGEATAFIVQKDSIRRSAVRGDEVVASMSPDADGAEELIARFVADGSPLISGLDAGEGEASRDQVAVPLLDGDVVVGALLVQGRLGPDEFSESDARLLEALANELVLTLDSYRLFEQVAEERERFQKIFEGSKEGIALLDEEGVIQAWNPALERITGYHEEDILGERWSERVLVRDMEHRRIEGMDIVQVAPDEELEVVTRQGPARWVSLLTGQVQTGDEKQWVVIVRDITAEHEIEEAKSDFLSTISHELRTPLTTIKGSLQMLGRPAAAPQSDVGKQMVDIMRRGADRLERLVMNLLTVSQMETGTMQVFPDEVGLRELIESRIKSVLIDHPQVSLTGAEDVVVRADRERLGQVVEHLLDNARKFGGPEGVITIDIAKENGYAHLTVTDEGPGIPRSDQDRVFDRFTRLGHLLTRETQGAGVGLFIAKTAVEAMSGEIYVESDGHLGSTFHVRIPLAQPVAVQEPATSA